MLNSLFYKKKTNKKIDFIDLDDFVLRLSVRPGKDSSSSEKCLDFRGPCPLDRSSDDIIIRDPLTIGGQS